MTQKKFFNYFITVLLAAINFQIFCVEGMRVMNIKKEEFEIPLTEDLMREHGILNRILLIYEEIIKRIDNNTDFSIIILKKAINIINSFIEDYHEKLEENYVFPIFEKHKKEMRLIRTLKRQHNQGREITGLLKKITAEERLNKKSKRTIKSLLKKFITMYRPHEAREDTELFPQVRSLISQKEFDELSEKFEDIEHQLFGEDGFRAIVKEVEDIEKELGIYNLEQFTPSVTE